MALEVDALACRLAARKCSTIPVPEGGVAGEVDMRRAFHEVAGQLKGAIGAGCAGPLCCEGDALLKLAEDSAGLRCQQGTAAVAFSSLTTSSAVARAALLAAASGVRCLSSPLLEEPWLSFLAESVAVAWPAAGSMRREPQELILARAVCAAEALCLAATSSPAWSELGDRGVSRLASELLVPRRAAALLHLCVFGVGAPEEPLPVSLPVSALATGPHAALSSCVWRNAAVTFSSLWGTSIAESVTCCLGRVRSRFSCELPPVGAVLQCLGCRPLLWRLRPRWASRERWRICLTSRSVFL